MSGALSGFTDPSNWEGKGLLKTLIGLPIGGAIGSPQWIKKYPESALAAAAVAATVLSAGAAAPAFAGAAGAGEGAAAGGAGAAAEMGAGAAGGGLAGSSTGLLGAGGADVMTGAVGGLDAAAPYAGELASVGESGGTMLGGAAPQAVTPQTPGLLGQIRSAMDNPMLKNAYKGYQNYQRTQSAIDALSPQNQQRTAPAQRPPQYNTPIVGSLDQPPSTPYSPYDPLWVAYLRRHPQQGASYG